MSERHLIIIGGGLAGLSAGCYARRNGYRTTIVEHHVGLGGVCTAWQRGPYTIDGCIQWLTGGPFTRIYEELEIVPEVELRTIDSWVTYRDVRTGLEVPFTRDLGALVARLGELSGADRSELARLRVGAAEFSRMLPPVDAPELSSLSSMVRSFWEMRGAVGPLIHFRQPVSTWVREHLVSPTLRRIFLHLVPESAPAFFLLMVLGYLEAGYLSRPVGGTGAFRGALERAYLRTGGGVRLGATVDEILVGRGATKGVRLSDGSYLAADAVICTASAPETVLRLLGGAYGASALCQRLDRWGTFDPIVLASFGVARSYVVAPALLTVDGIEPFEVGARSTDYHYLRICNDDPSFAPRGHSVVQLMARTDYEWWATRGDGYAAAKHALAEAILDRLAPYFPGLREGLQMVDVATPLTYWSRARSWRGAYEAWLPTSDNFFSKPPKTVDGVAGLYLAGQWVEPGGGVPSAMMSGRQAVQLLCRDDDRRFAPITTGA